MKKTAALIVGLVAAAGAFAQSSLTREETAAARAEVWSQWCAAQQALEECVLPPLTALDSVKPAQWTLPADLEPNAVMPFLWGSKGDSVPEGGYPLFIYLHGSGPKAIEWANGLRLARTFNDAPAVYFIPQIPNEGPWYRWWQLSKQYAWEQLLRRALASGLIDPDRVYIFGISEGGYGSQRLASFYADYLAGAGPMAGGEPLKNAPAENLRNVAFSLRTGARDFGFYREKLTRRTGAALDSLRNLYGEGFVSSVELIPGAGHGIDYTPTTPWLRRHVRNPYPKVVSWEDYDMDGRHRNGFYNLRVDRRPDSGERTRYDMYICGNTVDLTACDVTYTTTETDPRWGIALDFARSYAPATSGRVTIFLSDELVDLDRPVTVRVNGRELFSGMLQRRVENLRESCETFGDPRRLYPAAVQVSLEDAR